MAVRTPREQIDALRIRLGVHVERFAEFAAGELWRRAERCALDQGFTAQEAQSIAATTVKNAIAAMAGGCQQALRERLYRKGSPKT